jgi:hypothetical protein
MKLNPRAPPAIRDFVMRQGDELCFPAQGCDPRLGGAAEPGAVPPPVTGFRCGARPVGRPPARGALSPLRGPGRAALSAGVGASARPSREKAAVPRRPVVAGRGRRRALGARRGLREPRVAGGSRRLRRPLRVVALAVPREGRRPAAGGRSVGSVGARVGPPGRAQPVPGAAPCAQGVALARGLRVGV